MLKAQLSATRRQTRRKSAAAQRRAAVVDDYSPARIIEHADPVDAERRLDDAGERHIVGVTLVGDAPVDGPAVVAARADVAIEPDVAVAERIVGRILACARERRRQVGDNALAGELIGLLGLRGRVDADCRERFSETHSSLEPSRETGAPQCGSGVVMMRYGCHGGNRDAIWTRYGVAAPRK